MGYLGIVSAVISLRNYSPNNSVSEKVFKPTTLLSRDFAPLDSRDTGSYSKIIDCKTDGFMNAAGYKKIHKHSPCPLSKLERDDGRLSLFLSENQIASSPCNGGSGVLSVCVLLEHNGGSKVRLLCGAIREVIDEILCHTR
jgi:hypothetical protein